MAGSMTLSTVVVPRKLRLRFCDMRACKWLVPEQRCLAFPLAVKRNRFFVPLWVFILGMISPELSKISKKCELGIVKPFAAGEKGESAGDSHVRILACRRDLPTGHYKPTQPTEVPQVVQLFFERKFALAFLSIGELNRFFAHLLAAAFYDQLKPDFVTHGVEFCG